MGETINLEKMSPEGKAVVKAIVEAFGESKNSQKSKEKKAKAGVQKAKCDVAGITASERSAVKYWTRKGYTPVGDIYEVNMPTRKGFQKYRALKLKGEDGKTYEKVFTRGGNVLSRMWN